MIDFIGFKLKIHFNSLSFQIYVDATSVLPIGLRSSAYGKSTLPIANKV